MSEHPDDIEARLRAALAARADAVEPAADGIEVVGRMAAARDAARRRRAVLSAAAAVVVIALLAGAFLLLGDDDPDTDVAAGGSTTVTTSTTVPGSAPDVTRPVLWPLPTMSISYAEPADAVAAFGTGYLGLDPSVCVRDPDPEDGTLLLIPSPEGCSVDGGPDPRTAFTTVAVERRPEGWVVTGAESSWLEVTPAAGAVVGADIVVDVVSLAPPEVALTARVPALGAEPASAPAVDTSIVPLGADGTWHLVLGAADGPTVLIVSNGISATARPFTVDSTAVPVATTTTTTGPTDDGTQGWPGPTSRHFDSPEAAAQAFVADVLGFAEPTLAGQVVEGTEAELRFRPRPAASIETAVALHDTGSDRGWVVTGVTATSGEIDSVARTGDDVTVTGSASAFEALVQVRLLDVAGNVLGETTTMAGGTEALEPFTAVVRQEAAAEGPVYVQIAEGDESGEGTYLWAVWALVP
jgi:hypothetical protein